MKCYKLLEADNQQIITDKLYEFIINKTDILAQELFWNDVNIIEILNDIPELTDFFVKYNLVSPTRMSIICVPNNSSVGKNIHIDQPGENIRLLWPIKNCQGSFTRFFKVDSNFIKLQYLDNGVPFYHITDSTTHTMIDELELLVPVIFNSAMPHGICPNPDSLESRLTFTAHFENSLDHYLM